MDRPDHPPVTFTYTNWKGETAERHVIPICIDFGSNEWHKEPQWLLVGYDVDKKAERSFVAKHDITNWRPDHGCEITEGG